MQLVHLHNSKSRTKNEKNENWNMSRVMINYLGAPYTVAFYPHQGTGPCGKSFSTQWNMSASSQLYTAITSFVLKAAL